MCIFMIKSVVFKEAELSLFGSVAFRVVGPVRSIVANLCTYHIRAYPPEFLFHLLAKQISQGQRKNKYRLPPGCFVFNSFDRIFISQFCEFYSLRHLKRNIAFWHWAELTWIILSRLAFRLNSTDPSTGFLFDGFLAFEFGFRCSSSRRDRSISSMISFSSS